MIERPRLLRAWIALFFTHLTSPTSSMCAECPKCAVSWNGVTCCGIGASWEGRCGRLGDSKYEYTWSDGLKACEGKEITEPTTTTTPESTTPELTTPSAAQSVLGKFSPIIAVR